MEKKRVLHIEEFRDSHSAEEFYAATMKDHLRTRHKDIALPHSHDFYVTILFTQGSGIHEVDFTSYEVKPGALFFLNPGQTHHWELSEDIDGYIFLHSQTFYDMHYTHNRLSRFPFFYSMHQSSYLQLSESNAAIMTVLFEGILLENLSENNLKRQAIVSMADLVYVNATRIYLNENPEFTDSNNSYYNKFRQFEGLVEQHYKQVKLPSAYADMMAITPKHLNRITQSVVGKTASEVVLDRILLEARKLLVHHSSHFNEVSEKLGYEDYAYFSKVFRKKTGDTPKAFLARYGK